MSSARKQQTRMAKATPPLEGFGVWLTAHSAARYLDFSHCADPVDAFRRFAKRAGLVARGRRGDVPLYARADLDKAIAIVHEARV